MKIQVVVMKRNMSETMESLVKLWSCEIDTSSEPTPFSVSVVDAIGSL